MDSEGFLLLKGLFVKAKKKEFFKAFCEEVQAK